MDDQSVIVYVLAAIIGLVVLFAVIRLFAIANDVKAIREYLTEKKPETESASTNR